MSEKEATEKQIDDTLTKIMDAPDDIEFEKITHSIKFLARILFNVRFDLDAFKIEIIEFLNKLKIEEGKPEPEEIKMGPEDIKTIDDNLEDCLRDPCRYS